MPKRTETGDWTKFFGLLTQLAPSPAVREAAQRVFGLAPQVTQTKPDPPDPSLCSLTRMLMVQRFEIAHPGVSAAEVYSLLHVHKSDWYKWRRGELPDKSSVTKRIEAYLAEK